MTPSQAFTFMLNGAVHTVRRTHPNTTVLNYLKQQGLTGSKEGCAEGDCGACTVALVERDAEGALVYRAVNSCIMLVPMLAGRQLVTVEGVSRCGAAARSVSGLHPVQASMVRHYGSQCGYCTPGFIMSMFEASTRPDVVRPEQIADALSGNLCRCTGYRPIREAMQEAIATIAAERQNAQPPHDDANLKATPAVSDDAAVQHEAPLVFGDDGATFLRPTSLPQLLEWRSYHADAALVAGATEIGVDITKKARVFTTLLSTEAVPELHRIDFTEAGVRIGGAATLSEVDDALGAHIPALGKMLRVFASRQIRNRATIAGNIVTASPIGDMAPVLLALDARVILTSLRGTRTVSIDAFFTGYRTTVLEGDEIVEAVLLPSPPAGRVLCDSYKVSKRREMDISIVAAAFRIILDARGNVRDARLAYGGVSPTPSRAAAAEKALLGKRWTPALFASIQPLLEASFTPIDDGRAGAAYRRALVASLFGKFLHGDQSAAMEGEPSFLRSPGDDGRLPQAPSPGVHDDTQHIVASRDLRHESAVGHTTGAARYTEDQALRRPMLEMWPVCAPHARARILRRDVQTARAMPGIVDVLLAEDIPGRNDVGAVKQDEPLLAHDQIAFHGQMVAVVIGETLQQCRAAAARVEVEYAAQNPVLSIQEAEAADSFHTEPQTLRRGDCQTALAQSPHRLQGEFYVGGQEHFYLETHAAWAEMDDDGSVRVVSSTQHPSEVQTVIAHVLGLRRHQVVVQSPRMGGAFGGKETQGNTWSSLVALAAYRTGRAVRVKLDRDLDIKLTGKRHSFLARYEVGFDDEGLLTALRASLTSDGGWTLDLSQSICDRALFHIDNVYYLPHVEVTGRVARTNLVSNTAFRGFGGPQGMLVIEEVMDRIARTLQLRPEWVRERNLYRGDGDTNTTHYGQPIGNDRIQRLWETVQDKSDFAVRLGEVQKFNARHVRLKRGIAVTGVKFGISFTASFLNQAGALLVWYRDGSLQVNHGGTEMGQGLHTKLQGIVMRELGLSADLVRMMPTSTDKVPNTSATAASSGADLNGAAVANACRTLKTRLTALALQMLSVPRQAVDDVRDVADAADKRTVDAAAASSEQLDANQRDDLPRTHQAVDGAGRPKTAANQLDAHAQESHDADSLVFADNAVYLRDAPHTRLGLAALCEQAHLQQISLSATGYYRTRELHWDRATTRGKPFHYFAGGAAVAEVEVDGWTGMKRVLRVDIVHDVGDSLNPGIDRGQIEGGFVQGLGWLTGEELKWDKTGRLLTHSASTYQIPSFSDAPADFRVHLLPQATNDGVIHGSKAVGEPPLMLAFSVREAIRDAIAAFGENGGCVELASPATHEAILAAITRRMAAPSGADVARSTSAAGGHSA